MKLTTQVASDVERDILVVEIWQGDYMIAEVRSDQAEDYLVEIYPNPNNVPWIVTLDDLNAALARARKRLG